MNFLGFKTLYQKEVNRFFSVYNQTIVAPVINALLLLAVFSLAYGRRVSVTPTMSLEQFIVPGLIMMAIVQNAFANTSSSLIFAKVLGTIVDLLIPPLSPKQVTIAIILGGVTRGVVSGIFVCVALLIVGYFTNHPYITGIHSAWLLVFYVFAASFLLASLGLLGAIFSDSFDHMSLLTNFIITPLSFLSGTFYSISMLPKVWQHINHFNPFFYMIDGFRYSITGHADASIANGITFLTITNIVIFVITYKLFEKGYRIKG